MNRKKEFEAMIEELNRSAPGLEATLDRAYKKKRKRTTKLVACPVSGLAACFVVFVLLVNFCTPVAYACARIPVLRELAAAVTLSRSLTDAVDNEYVQTMDLSQTKNDITAEITYLIVDQKQVNIFYRLYSDKYKKLTANPAISCDNEDAGFCVLSNDSIQENGELLSVTVDFTQGNVPDKLQCTLRVYSNHVDYSQTPADESANGMNSEDVSSGPDYLAEMEFTLEFDPKFTASGKVFPVNETVILDGQTITVTNIEVYPTHMRVEIAESGDNTAWLKNLDFYIETDRGMKFEPVSNGITAFGSIDSPSIVSYRAASPYFYEAEHLKLVITGAKWLRKDMKTTYLNLVTGEHGELPEGAEFDSARKQDSDWVVKFRAKREEDGTMHRLFGDKFMDSEGNEYVSNQWRCILGDTDEKGNITYFYDEIPLENYPYDEVWLSPLYSHYWTAEDLIVITVQ